MLPGYTTTCSLKKSKFFKRLMANAIYGNCVPMEDLKEFRKEIRRAFLRADSIAFRSRPATKSHDGVVIEPRRIMIETTSMNTIKHTSFIAAEYFSVFCYELFEAIQNIYPPEDPIWLADTLWKIICDYDKHANTFDAIDPYLEQTEEWSMVFEETSILFHTPIKDNPIDAWTRLDTRAVTRAITRSFPETKNAEV